MKLKELQIIANGNYKSLILSDVSYAACCANGTVRTIPQDEVGAWGWYVNDFDSYYTALADLDYEENIPWHIHAEALANTEVNANYVLFDDQREAVIVKFVRIFVDTPEVIATSDDGKLTVSTTYGDGYIVDYGDNSYNWFADETDAMAEVEEYNEWDK